VPDPSLVLVPPGRAFASTWHFPLWSPSHKGALWVVPDGREATRWSDTRLVAEPKVDVLDVNVICPLAESYVSGAAIEAGVAAEDAASRMEAKCADLGSHYMFKPIAVEILCVFNSSASSF